MIHIDKKLHKEQGEQIVSEFLECFWRRRNAYPDDMYAAFSTEFDDAHNHVRFKKRLVDEVLVPEQNGLCCYCLRRLSTCKNPNVEHLMPNHAADKAELDRYRTLPTELDGLPHSENFRQANTGFRPPHPHSIAYQNLVMSCDGLLFEESRKPASCNLRRAHSFLPPFVLYPNIGDKFIYWPDGMAEWTDDPLTGQPGKNAVSVLRLNSPILKMVRRIWFFCNDNGFDPRNDNRETIINNMFGSLRAVETKEGEMLMNFKRDKNWKLLLEYDAFGNIRHS